MAVLLLTYDLDKEKNKDDYDKFYEIINKFEHFQLSESSYALVSNLSPDELSETLELYRDQNDSVTIITLSLPFSAYPQEAQAWLSQHL